MQDGFNPTGCIVCGRKLTYRTGSERSWTRTINELTKGDRETIFTGIIDSNRLQFVSQCWSKILELLTGLPDTKFDLVFRILELFQSDEISITLAYDMIIKLI